MDSTHLVIGGSHNTIVMKNCDVSEMVHVIDEALLSNLRGGDSSCSLGDDETPSIRIGTVFQVFSSDVCERIFLKNPRRNQQRKSQVTSVT